jgi:hypothetical protein
VTPRLALAAVLVLGTFASSARADSSVSVALDQNGQALASQLGFTPDQLAAAIQDKIDSLYRISGIDGLLQAIGDTGSFSQRGLGVDYDPDDRDITFGVSVAGVHGNVAIGTSDSLLGGSIADYAVMAGVNLGRWGQPRWTVFANGGYETTTIHGVTGDLSTGGIHAQYRVVGSRGDANARWSGVFITSGIELAKWTMNAVEPIESHVIVTGPGGTKSIHMSSSGLLTVDSHVTTIPLEVTTAVRLGRHFELFGGAGLDIALGHTTAAMQLTSQLTVNNTNDPVGTAQIAASGAHDPRTITTFAIGGLGLHTRHVRVTVHTAVSSDELLFGLALRGAI